MLPYSVFGMARIIIPITSVAAAQATSSTFFKSRTQELDAVYHGDAGTLDRD